MTLIVVTAFAAGFLAGVYVVLELCAHYGRRRTAGARAALRSPRLTDEALAAERLRPRSGLVTKLPGDGNVVSITRADRR